MKPQPQPAPGVGCGQREYIDLTDRFALRDWLIVLDTTMDELLRAIQQVGRRASDVRTYLDRNR